MALETITDAEKQIIENIGKTFEAKPAEYGADALARLFIIHPGSKAYFSYDENNLEKLKNHGKKVVSALADAAKNLNNLKCNLDKLATKHGKELFVDPQNFPVFSSCIQVTLANSLEDFSPSVQLAVDKFLKAVNGYLSSKYR
ncbi:hemoglobin subunit alpha-like [Chiloscyllium punctatum]|uniref:hemoglobin subunit alpha-like n=1 Tax=Chiloscyllium punctatum TaxID=137246 RepID=UPI003B63E3CC